MIFAFLSHGAEVVDLTLNAIGSLRRVNTVTPIYCGCSPSNFNELEKHLKKLNVNIFKLNNLEENFENNYHLYGQKDFKKITHVKMHIIEGILQKTIEPVLYVDIDVSFIKDPVPYIGKILDVYDMCVQTEGVELFPPNFCTGVMGFRNTLHVHDFLARYRALAEARGETYSNQAIYNLLSRADPEILKRIFPLPETIFCNGLNGQWVNPPPFDRVTEPARPTLVHANWMVVVEAKQDYLKSLGLWKLP